MGWNESWAGATGRRISLNYSSSYYRNQMLQICGVGCIQVGAMAVNVVKSIGPPDEANKAAGITT